MRTLAQVLVLLLSTVAPSGILRAQSVAGTYEMPTSSGSIVLTLEEQAAGVSGTLVGDDGITFRVQGTFRGGLLSAALANATGTVGMIEGRLEQTGVRFHLIPIDANGQPNHGSAQEFVMARQAPATGQPSSSPLSGLLGGAASPASGTVLSGSYSGSVAGTPATLVLERNGTAIRGVIDAGGYRYDLSGTANGATGQGTLSDPQAGAQMQFEVVEQGGDATVTILATDPNTGQVQRVPFEFRRGGSAPGGGAGGFGGGGAAPGTAAGGFGGGGAANQNEAVQRDPAIVGSWSRSDSYVSNDAMSDFSARTRYSLMIGADGSYAYGSDMSVGLDSGSGSTSGNAGSGVSRGQWRTERGVVYIMEPGSAQWTPYAQYALEGGSLVFRLGDGSRQVWHRR
jgi:hypothetical protein